MSLFLTGLSLLIRTQNSGEERKGGLLAAMMACLIDLNCALERVDVRHLTRLKHWKRVGRDVAAKIS